MKPTTRTATTPAERRALESVDPAVLKAHEGGKLTVTSRAPLRDRTALSLAYTPGVAQMCSLIERHPRLATAYTGKGNTVAVVSDGTAVLGLGDTGPLAALPVMEGKAALFAEFAGVHAVPLVLDTTDVDEIVDTVVRLAPAFGGINLEDIAAPRCFEIERRLRERLNIPVFHDDQHGTAIVVLGALHTALRLTSRDLNRARVVVSGAGAAGTAITDLLLAAGASRIVVCDRGGVLHRGRGDIGPDKARLADKTNPDRVTGTLADALVGADVFIGVSGGTVTTDDLRGMRPDPILFALANPTPEIDPRTAARIGGVYATGRSDLPNQINNVLVFPGVFRGVLDSGAERISTAMKLDAAGALTDLVAGRASPSYIVPTPFDPRVVPAVARSVAGS